MLSAKIASNAEAGNEKSPIHQRHGAKQHKKAVIVAVLGAYCASGTLLTIANKLAIKIFHFPNAIVAFQNGMTVAMLCAGSAISPSAFGNMPTVTPGLIRLWMPLVVLFVCMLTSSLLALMHVSAVTLIVIRNLNSLTVAAMEWAVLGVRVPRSGVAALVGLLAGAVLYGCRDMSFSATGYAWLAVNIVSTTAYQVRVKQLISGHVLLQGVGPLGFAYLNNLLSLPLLALMWLGSGEAMTMKDAAIDRAAAAVLLTSALLGFCLSVTGFKLNMLISATSMMVANNVNKVGQREGVVRVERKVERMEEGWGEEATCPPCMAPPTNSQFFVILISEAFVQTTLDAFSTTGTILVIFFGVVYASIRSTKKT